MVPTKNMLASFSSSSLFDQSMHLSMGIASKTLPIKAISNSPYGNNIVWLA